MKLPIKHTEGTILTHWTAEPTDRQMLRMTVKCVCVCVCVCQHSSVSTAWQSFQTFPQIPARKITEISDILSDLW